MFIMLIMLTFPSHVNLTARSTMFIFAPIFVLVASCPIWCSSLSTTTTWERDDSAFSNVAETTRQVAAALGCTQLAASCTGVDARDISVGDPIAEQVSVRKQLT